MRYMFDREKFAIDLHTERWKRQLTMQDVAERVGASKAAVCRWENGKQDPPVIAVLLLVGFFTLEMNDYIKELPDDQPMLPWTWGRAFPENPSESATGSEIETSVSGMSSWKDDDTYYYDEKAGLVGM